MRVMAKSYRRRQDSVSRKAYMNSRNNYKSLLKDKKKAHIRKLQEEISNVKDSTTFWKTIKKLKYKNREENKVGIKEWEKYYKEQYKVRLITPLTFLDARQPYLDQDIDMSELDTILRKLKNNKTPEPDGIRNEFF